MLHTRPAGRWRAACTRAHPRRIGQAQRRESPFRRAIVQDGRGRPRQRGVHLLRHRQRLHDGGRPGRLQAGAGKSRVLGLRVCVQGRSHQRQLLDQRPGNPHHRGAERAGGAHRTVPHVRHHHLQRGRDHLRPPLRHRVGARRRHPQLLPGVARRQAVCLRPIDRPSHRRQDGA